MLNHQSNRTYEVDKLKEKIDCLLTKMLINVSKNMCATSYYSWFIITNVFYQTLLNISRYKTQPENKRVINNKSFWRIISD